ncbi:MAG: VWA domain-containing protein [Candidatus Nanohaloarchaea archaeon]
MQLVLTDQYANIFFLVNGLAILFYLGAKQKKKQRAMKFGNYETLQKVAGKEFLKSSNIVLIIRLLALTLLVVGISSPVIVQTVPSTRSDYMLAIDSSSSMLSSDIQPTRFDAAKSVTKEFVQRLGNNSEVGVVAFAGKVRTKKMTDNKQEVVNYINKLETGTTAGTAMGDALYSATSLLIGSNRSKTIMLVTDGRSNVGIAVNKSISFAQRNNVTVNAIGIGEKRTNDQQFGMINGKNATKADYPNLNTTELYRITNATGGNLTTVSNKSSLKKAFLDFQESKKKTDISRYFIFAALVMMLSEWVLANTRYSILP